MLTPLNFICNVYKCVYIVFYNKSCQFLQRNVLNLCLLSPLSMLPTTSTQSNCTLSSRDAVRHTAGAKRYKYLRRVLHFRQMDFEFALWQMFYLITSPQRVYRNFHYRKQTKDQWARDDPAFLVLLSIWLCGKYVAKSMFSRASFFFSTSLVSLQFQQ